MKRSIVAIGILLIGFVTIRCGKDDDASKSSMTLKVDGQAVELSVSTATLSFETQNDHEGRALQMLGSANGKMLTIGISNWDFQNPPENGIKVKTYTAAFDENIVGEAECLSLDGGSVELCEGILITYTVGDKMYMSALYEGEYDGFVKVTACDGSAKKASGEFDLKLDDGEGNELALEGSFENVTYIVVN
jgi:hypothetical protein